MVVMLGVVVYIASLPAAAIHLRLAAAVGSRPLAKLARHDDVPVVLHGVVGPAREEARDHGPLVAVELVCCQQPLLLFLREWAPVDARVQLVEPSQPAAFACTHTQQTLANQTSNYSNRI